MIFVLIAVIVICLCIILISRSEEIPDKCKESKLTEPCYKAGAFIYRKTIGKNENFYYRKIFDKNSLIYAAKENREITNSYFIEKFGICFLIIFVGTLLVLIISLKDNSEKIIKDNYLIEKGDYNKNEKLIHLNADVDGEKMKSIPIVVPTIKYSREEFDALMEEYTATLEKQFLGENDSPDFVNKSVNLIDSLNGYPFLIEWKWKEKNIIDSDGNVTSNVLESGSLVNFTAIITYGSYETIHEFAVNVYPKEMSKEEYFLQRINEMIAKDKTENLENEYLKLPDEIDGMKIIWSEEKSKNLMIFIAMIAFAVAAVFFGKDMDLDKQIEERNKQMMEDYSEIVGKFTLFVGAGMSVVGAWKKIAYDYYEKKKEGMPLRYAYEEMVYTMYEIESGVEESICYQHFANRVKVQRYVKMVSLLEQNIKMGAKGLLVDLKAEARDAFAERKNLAEKKGEESATKLLVPMFMMLLIVMVIIMFPAFMSM